MIDSLYATRGEKILPKFNALLDWVKNQTLQVGGANYSITYTRQGAKVFTYVDELSPIIRFKVVLKDNKVTVGQGTVNMMVPKVKGVPIDGDPAANPPKEAPLITLAQPDQKLFISYVCISCSFKPNGDLLDVSVVGKAPADIPGGQRADFRGTEKDIVGYIPIAQVRHNPKDNKPQSVYQHSVHNLQVRAYKTGTATRVIYWPA